METTYAWLRLLAAVVLSTLGGVGMWSVVVALPAVQAEFGVARGAASFPYTTTMIGFAFGGIFMGRLADRFGIVLPVLLGTLFLSLGCVAAAFTTSLWQFALCQGVLIGFLGCSATFGPLMADTSHWFSRRRGIAVAICASGSYMAGTIWPPILQYFIERDGWRDTYIGLSIVCLAGMLPLTLALRRRSPIGYVQSPAQAAHSKQPYAPRALEVSPGTLQVLLMIAGLACCIAMAMPQVHIVAYCGDLGYGVARGAEMLSLMLGCGVISRLASGWICDRIGGVPTLLVGSLLQCLTLLFYLPFDGLVSLYIVSALFGLSQGGIVPSYAIIVREYFPAQEAGSRVGLVIMSTIVGMAFGGWLSGVIFDLTGSYRAAFLHGIVWNFVNAGIALWLLRQSDRRLVLA